MKKHLDVVIALVILVVTGIVSWTILKDNITTSNTSLNKNGIDLRVGEVYKLDIKNDSKYESENPEVAEIDSNGLITAKSVGTTTIKVKTDDEEKTYTVEVIEIIENTKDIKNSIITEVSTQNYTGSPITPIVEVALNGKKLEPEIDYSITYSNNTNVGNATLTIIGKGEYTGSKSISFKIENLITKKTDAQITCINPVYNGLQQQIATCTGGVVKNDKQTDVGEYKVTCTGDSLHYDAKELTCKITQASINDAVISTIAEQIYTGDTIEPDVEVATETENLVEESDYVVEYKNNVETGTAEAIIKGEGNYTGTTSVPFKIDNTSEKPKAIITCSNNKIYNGAKQTIAVCSGGTIKNAVQTNVGSYKITCTGDSTHKDADSKTCKITSGNIGNAVVTAIKSQEYTGKEIKPAVTLTLNGKKLENNKDYTLSYKNNKNVGTADIIVAGKGNYAGTKKINFTINAPAIKKTPAVITCRNNIYNGESQTIATCSGGIINDASQKDAGTYNVSCAGDSTHTNVTKSCAILRADLSKSQITAIADQVYSNKAVTPSVTVLFNSKKLTTSDYTVKYSNNNKLGTATVTVTGKGNYTGTKTATFKIVKEKTPAVITCANKEYNGAVQTIATCSGGTIKNATQSKVGSYSISCTGDSAHKDAASKSCSITKKSISNATVPTIANQAYTGKAITPQVTVKLGSTVLENTNYTVSYSNNINEGIATVTITGKGNYAGTKQVTFKILKRATITCSNKVYNRLPQTIATCSGGTVNNASQTKVGNYNITCTPDANHTAATSKSCSITQMDINGVTISAVAKQKYTGKAITPTVNLSQDRKGLVKDTDYTIAYKNNTNKGTASIVLTGKGNYKGTKTVNFVIADPATIKCSNKVYNGSAQTIATCTGGTVTGASQTNVGTYTVSCKGDSTHTDVSAKCTISQLDISKTMALSLPNGAEYKYTGKAITPAVTVKYNSKTLTKGTDYTVAYTNNTNKGTATITVTAKGNYKGSKTINFKIVDKLSTAVESVSLNTTSLSLKSKATSTLTATVKPSTAVNKAITWTSSNPIIARVDANGKVTGVKPGTATITATTSDGKKTATAKVTVTEVNKTVASYESSTLKYWIEYVSEPTRTAKHKGVNVSGQQPTYIVTHIWVSDPYNQVKTAITPKASSSQSAEYPRKLQKGSAIINNEITAKGYQNKGLVAINASGMVNHSAGWCSKCPNSYEGTAIMPLQIYEGKVIRDSTNTEYSTIGGGRAVFITKAGTLTYKGFTTDYAKNATKKAEMESLGAKYTWGTVSIGHIISNYQITKEVENDQLATRQALCQIDKNNFILITSHLNGASAESNHNSCGAKTDMQCPRIMHGLRIADVQRIMIEYGCKSGYNLDGGGSVSYFYKNTSGSNATRVKIASSERTLADMLYFVEK